MGKLDFSRTDKRYSKPKNKVEVGGGVATLDGTMKFYAQHKRSFYLEENNGYTEIITMDGKRTRFITDKTDKKGSDVLHACKAVKKDVRKFAEENEIYKHGEYMATFNNVPYTSDYILSGGEDVSYVDINHCYWRILYNFGIITERTYDMYKNNRDARLVSVGNLNRRKFKKLYKDGVYLKTIEYPNEFKWAWDFVCFTTYKAIKGVVNHCHGEIFAFFTDGVYLPVKHAAAASEYLSKIGLPNTCDFYKVVGKAENRLILQNTDTGVYKRANMSVNLEVKHKLKKIDFNSLNIPTDEANV